MFLRAPRYFASDSLLSLHMMYESVDVVGLNPSPNPFLMMEYYNQSRGCLIPEKGLVPGAPHPYSTSIRNQHWNGSNHCRWLFLSSKLHSTQTSISVFAFRVLGGTIPFVFLFFINVQVSQVTAAASMIYLFACIRLCFTSII